MTLFVQPFGGLCNRLHVIVSHLLVARGRQEKLVVFWSPQAACPALFRDLIVMPIATDLEIREPAVGPTETTTLTWHKHPESPPEAEWITTAMEVLVPLPAIQLRINKLLGSLGTDFTALHIRQTEHDNDVDYVTFAGSSKVFAATDNIQSMLTLKRGLGDRLVYGCKFTKAGNRTAAVKDVVVDLWVCARAARFKGSCYSSFSDWIEMMRGGLTHGSA